jgi:hypothetical protein
MSCPCVRCMLQLCTLLGKCREQILGRVVAILMLLCGSKWWTLTKEQTRRREAAEMRFPECAVAECTMADWRIVNVMKI